MCLNIAIMIILVISFPCLMSADNEKRKVIIDTDGGADDAMAIVLALRLQSDIQVMAFTSCPGNANATQAAINVIKTLRVLNRSEIPVHQGCESYYTTSNKLQDDWFGRDAFGDFEFPNAPTEQNIQEEHGVMTLLRLSRQYPGEITLICLGPLTNIAHALKLDPKFMGNIKEIIVMGGTVRGHGNDSPGTEFNIRRDPEAAALLFQHSHSKQPVTVVPWETCLDTMITKEWRKQELGGIPTYLMDFINKAERIALAKSKAANWYAADPLAILAFIRPEIIMKIDTPQIVVCTDGNLGRGVMLLDWTCDDDLVNSRILSKINAEMYKRILIDVFSQPSRNISVETHLRSF